MPRRRRKPGPLSRSQIVLLVKDLLERAADKGMTKAELVAAIGANRTSPQTVQRALVELRERYDGEIRYSGRDQRWRLAAPIAMPLDAPDRVDLAIVLFALAILEPLFGPALAARIRALVEQVDERVRRYTKPGALPTHKAMTSIFTLGSPVDPEILQRLHNACRKKTVRIHYASPWKPARTRKQWLEVEPWALRLQDGAIYLRAWARGRGAPRTFRGADIEAIEEIADRKGGAP
jgi:predicted DNA-binding transcriptional regulator YafY